MTRLLDVIISAIAIILLLPVFIPVIIILRFTGEGVIFYTQERIGQYRISFNVLKFATMLKNSPNLSGGYLTQKDDPRVLPFGKFLRKTKINELPQLFNIFIGDMSFIGPRPQVPVHFNLYTEEQKEHIEKLRPGLTGIGSLIFRDEEGILEKSGKDFGYMHDLVITPYKGELEKWYFKNRSSFLYVKIFIFTAVAVINSKIYVMKYFKGLPDCPDELKGLI